MTATRISALALPWFVLVTTGSPTRMGLVAFCELAPYVLAMALAGPLVDRVGPRTVSWVMDLASAAAALLVPLGHALDLLSFPLLLLLVALIGVARGPGDLAKEVMVPEAAERAGVPLERATGLSGVVERLAATVGPVAGGVLITLTGPLAGLLVNAVCFALGAVLVALVLPRRMGRAAADGPPAPDAAPGTDPGTGTGTGTGADTGGRPAEAAAAGYWRQFAEGCAFLRSDRLLFMMVSMVGVTNLLDSAFSTVLLPLWAAESDGGPALIGLLTGASAASAIGGSLLAAVVAHRLPRRVVLFTAFLLAGAPRFLILTADGAPTGAVLTVFVVSGFGAGFLNPILSAVWFERVPRRMLGRVNALGDAVAWAGMPLGGLLAGAVVTAAGLLPVLVVSGVLYVLTTSLTGLRPEWRAIDRSPAAAASGGSAAPAAPD
ncbi:conserved hypothetical protein [Streptomyces clavuligerus]|nr:conserved hypothetical protein [Streptomyces clavuligerus]